MPSTTNLVSCSYDQRICKAEDCRPFCARDAGIQNLHRKMGESAIHLQQVRDSEKRVRFTCSRLAIVTMVVR